MFRAMRILVVEDDQDLAKLLDTGLTELGFRVERATNYQEARTRVALGTYDVIVVDVMLPGGLGIDLCREWRRRSLETPILVLTARDSIDDRVKGLEAGADDYLTKPFAFQELVARLRALARRPGGLQPEIIRIADLEVNLATRGVRRGDRVLNLTAKEFALLELFVRHAGRVVDRSAISAYVWDENHDPFTNVLEALVRRLRRKIDDPFEKKLIHTLRGAGYRLGE
ncbi:MAG TPA: response regulator transcription factor [Gemmatimonadaceae bacterium]|jgi:two-component system copper resistance phosphate regulon response regulator CusR